MKYAIKEYLKSKSISNAVSVFVVMTAFHITVIAAETYLKLNGVK